MLYVRVLRITDQAPRQKGLRAAAWDEMRWLGFSRRQASSSAKPPLVSRISRPSWKPLESSTASRHSLSVVSSRSSVLPLHAGMLRAGMLHVAREGVLCGMLHARTIRLAASS